LLPAYVDKELSLSEVVDFEQHLNSCATCQIEYQEQMRVGTLIKNNALYFEAKSELAKLIETAIAADLSNTRPQKTQHNFWNFNWLGSWAGIGGSKGILMASLALLIVSTSLFLAIPSAQEKLTEELTASHIRSLQADHLSDVISTDQHTVKPWFNGKLDYAPPVVDLTAVGFPITGGRLDYINGKSVAVVIYHHNKHPINLYVWPNTSSDSAVHTIARKGYTLVHWATGGMNYWAVSDIEAGKLTSFAEKLQAQVSVN
jgi:anti-sigma factor RsiW